MRDGDVVRPLSGAGPARARIEAAVLAAVAGAGGCRAGGLTEAVSEHLGVPLTPVLVLRVRSALGLLIVAGAIDERGGRLHPGQRARRAG
ncbi:MAG: hypothetical protein RIB67_00765 [Miltoncostaeaceae bacterium]